MTIARKVLCLITLAMAVVLGPRAAAQVQTDVPAVVPGAKPVSVERIKIHGKALEGNLEGDAVDRDVLVFLPPSYQKEKHTAIPSCMHSTDIPSAPNSGPMRSTYRRPLKVLSPRVRKR